MAKGVVRADNLRQATEAILLEKTSSSSYKA